MKRLKQDPNSLQQLTTQLTILEHVVVNYKQKIHFCGHIVSPREHSGIYFWENMHKFGLQTSPGALFPILIPTSVQL